MPVVLVVQLNMLNMLIMRTLAPSFALVQARRRRQSFARSLFFDLYRLATPRVMFFMVVDILLMLIVVLMIIFMLVLVVLMVMLVCFGRL